MRIILTGYMGSGKSTTARRLSHKLGLNYVDTDLEFEKKFKINIRDFFNKYDEKAFRLLEHQLLKSLLERDDYIISLGGGTACYHNNMELVLDNGLVIYLKMSVGALVNRLSHSKRARPLISDIHTDELYDFISWHLKERAQYYEKAHMVVEACNMDISNLIEHIRSWQENQQKKNSQAFFKLQ